MKNALTILCMLLLSVAVSAQQVISSSALQSQRLSKSSSLRMSSSVGSGSVASVSVSPSAGLSSSSSSAPLVHSGSRLASTIYAPGATSVSGAGVSRRRIGGDEDDDDDIPGVTPGDPGTQSQNFPIGNEMVLLLIAAAWLIIKIAKRKNKILKI